MNKDAVDQQKEANGEKVNSWLLSPFLLSGTMLDSLVIVCTAV